MFPKTKRWESARYLAWVREQPCIVCGREAEAHHIKGVGNMSGIGRKAADWATMPLCHNHHDEMHRYPILAVRQWEMIARTLGKAIEDGFFK